MSEDFFKHPILNSPYRYPSRHWELDADGQPTNRLIESRRKSDLITPVPKAKKQRGVVREQADILFNTDDGVSTAHQQYDVNSFINAIRADVET